MQAVYGDAYLTIATTFAESGDMGRFQKPSRINIDLRPIPIGVESKNLGTAYVNRQFSHDQVFPKKPSPKSMVFARANRFRRIIHYGALEITWECFCSTWYRYGRVALQVPETTKQSFHSGLEPGNIGRIVEGLDGCCTELHKSRHHIQLR